MDIQELQKLYETKKNECEKKKWRHEQAVASLKEMGFDDIESAKKEVEKLKKETEKLTKKIQDEYDKLTKMLQE